MREHFRSYCYSGNPNYRLFLILLFVRLPSIAIDQPASLCIDSECLICKVIRSEQKKDSLVLDAVTEYFFTGKRIDSIRVGRFSFGIHNVSKTAFTPEAKTVSIFGLDRKDSITDSYSLDQYNCPYSFTKSGRMMEYDSEGLLFG